MPTVDTLAFVDAGARVAPDVVIGPFCWVGPDVVLESGVVLDSHVRIEGHTTIGAGAHVHAGAVLGGPPQDLKFKGVTSHLTVGPRTVIRECVTANVATDEGESTRIGADCLVMAYAHVAHNTIVGDRVILANGVQLAGYVTVEDFAIVGGLVPVHQFVKIGAHSMVGGGCRVPQDVLPYTRAAGAPLKPIGLNLIGLQRRGFSDASIAALKQAYRLLLRSGLKLEDACARIKDTVEPGPEVEHFVRFALESQRGVAR
jgi:UDP-N-acetylglucosamine acyltransferase